MFDAISTNEVWGQRSKLEIIKPKVNVDPLNLTSGLKSVSRDIFKSLNLKMSRLERSDRLLLNPGFEEGKIDQGAVNRLQTKQ